MKLTDYATSSTFERLSDGEPRLITLNISFSKFAELDSVTSETFQAEQYEVPVLVWDVALKESREGLIATRSKKLLLQMIGHWAKDDKAVLRVHCQGTGYRAVYTVKVMKKKPV